MKEVLQVIVKEKKAIAEERQARAETALFELAKKRAQDTSS